MIVWLLMGTIAWRLWGNRNEIRNGGKRLGELELCHDASLWPLQFKEANEATTADNAWMISGLKLSPTLPKVATKS